MNNRITTITSSNIAAAIGCLVSLGYGTTITWTSPAIPYLESQNSYFKISKEQSDTISSLLMVGFIIGYSINPLIVDRFGSKRTLSFYSIPQLISWLLIVLANNYMTICFARILAGIFYGAGICTLTIYLSEIGNPYTTGKFISFLNLAMGLGFFLVMLLGASLRYDQMNLVLLSIPIIFILAFVFVPDSSYFIEKMNQDEVEMGNELEPLPEEEQEPRLTLVKTTKFLKDVPEPRVRSSWNGYPESGENWNLGIDSDGGTSSRVWKFFNLEESSVWRLVTLRNNRRALFIVISIAVQDVFSGHTVMWTKLQYFLTHKGSLVNPKKATLFLPIASLAAAIMSASIIGRMRRKVLLLVTGIIGTLALAFTGAFFLLESNNYDISYLSWMPLVGLTTYELSFMSGPTNFFYLYQAELFSAEVKSVAIMVSKISYMTFSYFCIFRFLVFTDAVGKPAVFFIGSIVAGVVTLIVFCITPETKGKRIEEIEELLKSGQVFL